MKERMDVLEEQLEIIHDGHWGDGTFSFSGATTSSRTSTPSPSPCSGRTRR